MLRNILYIGVLFLVVLWTDVFADDDDTCECVLMAITDSVGKCSGWDDAPVVVNMQMVLEDGEEDMPDMVKLQGDIDVGVEMSDGYQIGIEINLETPNGKELVWSGGAEMCQSMADKDAPWAAILDSFNTTECPVPIDVYKIPGMRLSLDFANGFITEDFVGSYMITMNMEHTRDKIMCMEFGAEIFQETRSRDECTTCPADK
ncbi:hypothetical protein NE865_07601 [Phthorimaea operculella]|nr:hypothetical protein NE865_07601 [Phthorimaea operculella]